MSALVEERFNQERDTVQDPAHTPFVPQGCDCYVWYGYRLLAIGLFVIGSVAGDDPLKNRFGYHGCVV